MISNLNSVECITLFVEDLPRSADFYQKNFAVKQVYDDESCKVFRIDNIMINLLKISEAAQLVTPLKPGDRGAGARLMFTMKVDNVDAVCAALKKNGVELLNGPQDRPWGRRTAAFSDPSGNVWEVAQELLP